jgi:PEP-CTERM/exosortase A-associated glycosyltransferase
MRILHILDHSVPLHSGYTFRTLAILREQRALGWKTFHLTSPKHTASREFEEDVEGLKFYRTHWEPGRLAKAPILRQRGLMRATEERLEEVVGLVRPDILHAHSPVLNALPALRVARRHGLPVVYEVRAFWEDAAVDHGTSREWGLRYRATRALETYALRRADHVTTICEGLRTEIIARGVPASKVTVIPNAVDVNAFRFGAEPDTELKRALGLEQNIVVGYIGSFYAYEGLDLLVQALPSVLAERPEVRLLLVGGGPQEEALKALVAEHRLESKIMFTGRVPHAKVQQYYSIVDVFAYPRRSMRLTELVTPLKPLEAMAQGQLLIASDVGGHRELIRDGETGMLFRAGSAQALAETLLRLLYQRERWPQMRTRGRQFVEQERSWERSVARYREIFIRLAPGT